MSDRAWSSGVDSWRASCAKHPECVALEDGNTRWTYRDLEYRVGAWSARIAELPESAKNIAVQMPHQAEAVAAFLGILAAGRVALALDPTHPITYRVSQLKFCDVTVVLGLGETELRHADWVGDVIPPQDIHGGKLFSQFEVQPDSPAYLHFTSGSSGNPKAIALPHRAASCGVAHLQAMFGFTQMDRHALLSPLAVPASAVQILAVLAQGATLCLFEARDRSVAAIVAWLRDRAITTLQTVPSLWRALGREAAGKKLWPALRAIKLGGEPATASDARLFASCARSDACLINGLGLTEAGFNVCWSTWRSGEGFDQELLAIGRAPANLEIVVERSPGTAALNGEVGEIVVRSPSLPNGYWRDPTRSAQVYRDLPERPGWRELRTGDAGRWRVDGLLEYRGRLDEMVKIRGCGVAPTEVEASFRAIDGVLGAVVVGVNEVKTLRLHAFVQLRSDSDLRPEDLRMELAKKLPRYMVPSEIHVVSALPCLPNGKVDRAWLSQNDGAVASHPPASSEPDDAVRLQLLRLWQDALGSTDVGIHDDFFAIGGDSLAAATIFSGVAKFIGADLPISTLVDAPTIEKLAGVIKSRDWSEDNLRLVALELRGGRPALYCVPAAGGDPLSFRLLSRYLGPQQPCFAFRPQGMDGRQPYLRMVEEMAAGYIDVLHEHQATGPYYLCGYSFGGVVVVEMAQRLIAQGEEVRFLGLFDTYGGEYPRPRKDLPLRKRLRLGLQQIPSVANKKLGWSFFTEGIPEWWQIQRIRRDLVAPRSRRRRLHAERSLYAREACFLARPRYKLRPFPGKFHLFRAEVQLRSDLFEDDPLLGWIGVPRDGIEVHDILGTHGSIMVEPDVRVLAAKLVACLAAAAGMDIDPQLPSASSTEHGFAVSH